MRYQRTHLFHPNGNAVRLKYCEQCPGVVRTDLQYGAVEPQVLRPTHREIHDFVHITQDNESTSLRIAPPMQCGSSIRSCCRGSQMLLHRHYECQRAAGENVTKSKQFHLSPAAELAGRREGQEFYHRHFGVRISPENSLLAEMDLDYRRYRDPILGFTPSGNEGT